MPPFRAPRGPATPIPPRSAACFIAAAALLTACTTAPPRQIATPEASRASTPQPRPPLGSTICPFAIERVAESGRAGHYRVWYTETSTWPGFHPAHSAIAGLEPEAAAAALSLSQNDRTLETRGLDDPPRRIGRVATQPFQHGLHRGSIAVGWIEILAPRLVWDEPVTIRFNPAVLAPRARAFAEPLASHDRDLATLHADVTEASISAPATTLWVRGWVPMQPSPMR